jgi:hypothetical protein
MLPPKTRFWSAGLAADKLLPPQRVGQAWAFYPTDLSSLLWVVGRTCRAGFEPKLLADVGVLFGIQSTTALGVAGYGKVARVPRAPDRSSTRPRAIMVATAGVVLPFEGVCFTLGGSSSNCVGLVSEVLTRGCSGRRAGALMVHESRRRVGTRAWG